MVTKPTIWEFGEVPKEEYLLGDYLTSKDAKCLEDFIPNFVEILNEMGIKDPAVFAVGSSTFPNWWWSQLEHLREVFPEEADKIPKTYQNINLRIASNSLPNDLQSQVWETRSKLVSVLKKHCYEAESFGSYQDSENIIKEINWENAYSPLCGKLNSISFRHLSGFREGVRISPEYGITTPIDILFKFSISGVELGSNPDTNELITDPSERLKLERGYEGKSFSLLYPDYLED